MKRGEDVKASKLDWVTILIVATLAIAGWLNIYAVVYDSQVDQNIFDITQNSGKQLLWMGISVIAVSLIMIMDFRFFDSFAYGFYGVVISLLIGVLLLGTVVSGSKSWFEFGFVRFQPAEFAKFATALAIAKFLVKPQIKVDNLKTIAVLAMIVGLPAALIVLQGDTGSALVFGAFVLVLYREGLSPVIVLIGVIAVALFVLTLLFGPTVLIGALILTGVAVFLYWLITRKVTPKRIWTLLFVVLIPTAVILSVNWVVTDLMQPHQQNRVKAFVNPEADPLGYGYNVTQSKIAIGSGGFFGKGFLEGTQTKFDFVPEQSTDFIFCTIGEEHGWLGSFILIALFVTLLLRIVFIAERQKSKFSRVYGYGVAAILFFHFMVNIGMTIGLFPVIGIPLPFFSYGGSSLLAFSVLIFILLKMDAHRMQMLVR
ncbi:MAG: rod shape-determining protein RodA [Cyclobacteriaceae bacterium]|nr:rod shape-determining protein RodA [Cyclobacteriaceae bacterium]